MRGRAPRGGGGPDLLSLIPEYWWWWFILLGGLLILAGFNYRGALVGNIVRVPVPPVPVHVPSDGDPLPPLQEYENNEDEEDIMVCIVAMQWPKSHVLDKVLDPIYLQLVPQDRSVLHGMWCDVEIAGPSLPFDCSVVTTDDDLLRSASRNWPNLDPKDPGVDLITHNCKFWSDEWYKHGVHTGLTQEVYMKLALALFHRVAFTLDTVLQKAIESAGASSSSIGSAGASSSSKPGRCESQDLQDFVFPKRKHRKPEVHLHILTLETELTRDFAKPKILCRTPPRKKEIFHSVNLKVQVKVTKYSSASALPLCAFLVFTLPCCKAM